MKIAIFGGAFDPIHQAHLVVAAEAANKFSLDRVLFIPAANPPHKKIGTSYEDRFKMVELACAADPRFVASRLEENNQLKSYSIDTVERFIAGELNGESPPLFIIGADAFQEITTWYRWQELIRLVEFIVVARPGHVIQVPDGGRVHRLETIALDASSTEVRRELADGLTPAELPPAVAQYIREHGLYQS